MAPPTLEERVAALETEAEQLKPQKISAPSQNKTRSWEKIAGVFEDASAQWI